MNTQFLRLVLLTTLILTAIPAARARAEVTMTNATITGGSLTAGGGNVVINSSGVTLAAGGAGSNSINWSNGAVVNGNGTSIQVVGPNLIYLTASAAAVTWDGAAFSPINAGKDLGTSGNPWRTLYLTGNIHMTSPSTTTSADYPMVYSTGNTQLYRKTNGFNGTCNNPSSIVIERGIVVGCS